MKTSMKIKLFIIFCLTLSLTGCVGCSRVSAGHVGVQSTMVGSGRGMQDVAVGPAWVFYNPFTSSVIEYPTYVQTAVWTKSKDEGKPVNEEITFTSKDSMIISADVSIAYSLIPEKVPAFYLKFRSDDLDAWTQGFFRNMARQHIDDVAGHYPVEQIMGDNGPFLKEARAALQTEMDAYGVHIEQFGFIGAPRPPDIVKQSIDAKVQAVQLSLQKQNEIVSAEAEAKKQVATAQGEAQSILVEAEAQAKANALLANSITPTLIENKKIDKWNGVLPTVSSGGSGIMLSLPQKQ